jgi:ferric-dicitrate binding protein FerR (iron transport regulator)
MALAAASDSASVTYLAGNASKSRAKTGPWAAIKKGSIVAAGYYVKTEASTRVELTMPDGSKIRIAPNSTLFLSAARFRNGTRNYDANIVAGTVYTRARPSTNKSDRFVVRTNGAVAGIRGTAFNTILMPDGATRVKCFEGKVWVSNWTDYAQRFLREEQKIPTTGSLEAPVVPGPDVVTEEEWVKIAGAMMSVTVGADGKVQDPQQISSGDVDDWEDWNRKRDNL